MLSIPAAATRCCQRSLRSRRLSKGSVSSPEPQHLSQMSSSIDAVPAPPWYVAPLEYWARPLPPQRVQLGDGLLIQPPQLLFGFLAQLERVWVVRSHQAQLAVLSAHHVPNLVGKSEQALLSAHDARPNPDRFLGAFGHCDRAELGLITTT